MLPMGGVNKTAGLWAGLAGIIGASGLGGMCADVASAADIATAIAAGSRAAASSDTSADVATTAAGSRTAASSDASSLAPRFNAKGWVQADVHYDCSRAAPTQALAAAGLAINAAIK